MKTSEILFNSVTLNSFCFCYENDRHGVCINAKFEMGFDSSGKRIVAKSCHNTVIRSINYRKGYTPSKNETRDMKSIIQSAHHTASYSSKSLQLGNFEYPFPSGLYLARVVQLTRSISTSDPLLQMITDPCLGNKYSKEISEIMVSQFLQHVFNYYVIASFFTFSFMFDDNRPWWTQQREQ